MRRLLTLLLVVTAVLVPAPAGAATVCTIGDPRLPEVSGLVLDGTGYIAMNDGRPGQTTLTLYRVNGRCAVSGSIVDRRYDPFDPEDLGRTPDGTLWVADTGDNDHERKQPAILRLPKGAAHGVKFTLHYPDGPHDAEAVLMQADGTAIVVTKEILGVAHVFVTPGPLTGPARTVAMREAGRITITATDTPGGPLQGSTIVTTLVTGGAVAPDGHRVVLRTYTDAYEWDVPDGDIAAALVHGEPRRTPLPGELQGESIAYTADGAGFVTASEGVGQPLRRWVPTARPAPTAAPSAARAAAGSDSGGISLVAVLVGAGLTGSLLLAGLLAVLGVRAARRAVRRRRA